MQTNPVTVSMRITIEQVLVATKVVDQVFLWRQSSESKALKLAVMKYLIQPTDKIHGKTVRTKSRQTPTLVNQEWTIKGEIVELYGHTNSGKTMQIPTSSAITLTY